ncbi:adenosine deaminase [Jatrophihabitans sp. DSM 45814]
MRDLRGLPKVHLHVHLESTIRPATVAEIARENQLHLKSIGPSTGSLATISGARMVGQTSDSPLVGSEFRAFADQNGRIRDVLIRPEDFRRIAFEFCADEAAQGTRYAEVTFTAAAHEERLGQPNMPVEAVLDGLAAGRDAYGIESRLLLDHPRKRSVARAHRTLDLAIQYADRGVVGIGLAGEESHPIDQFEAVFRRAMAYNIHLVHHAGEACGPESIRTALGVGRAERIGHGITVLQDPELVAEMRELKIPLEVCPSSNVALGFARSIEGHPIHEMRSQGLVVTLNADIPSATNSPLLKEFELVRAEFNYDDESIAELNRAAIDASFAPAETKLRLHRSTNDWLT